MVCIRSSAKQRRDAVPRLLGPLCTPPPSPCSSEVGQCCPQRHCPWLARRTQGWPACAPGQDHTGRAGKACHRDLALLGGWEPHLDMATETSAVSLQLAFLSSCISSQQASSGRPSSLADGAPAWREPPSCPASLGLPSPPVGRRGQPSSSQPLRPLQSLGPADLGSQPSSLTASSTGQSCLMWPWAWGPAPEPL